jgi:signal transduction histidine kinase
MQNRRKDGSLYWVSASISPVHDGDGRITHFVAVEEDVTSRRLLEDELRQAQKMEAVGQLAGGVAHDFNNELTVISGYVELAKPRLAADPAGVGMLEHVVHAAHRAASLTQRLLAFSRRQVLRPKVVQLNDVVRGIERMLGRLVREPITVTTELAPGLGHVLVDTGQVEQALMNLCANARDAMPDGGIVTVSTADVELDAAFASSHPGIHPGRFACLSVRDSGCGMSDEVRAHVYEPFFTTKGVGEGTGLGLAMVYGFVTQSGGAVDCASRVGGGSTFRLFFPVADQPLAVTPAAAPARGRKRRDDPRARRRTRGPRDHDRAHRRRVPRPRRRTPTTAIATARTTSVRSTSCSRPGDAGDERASGRVRGASRGRGPRCSMSRRYGGSRLEGGTLRPDLSFLPKPFSPGGTVRRCTSPRPRPPAPRRGDRAAAAADAAKVGSFPVPRVRGPGTRHARHALHARQPRPSTAADLSAARAIAVRFLDAVKAATSPPPARCSTCATARRSTSAPCTDDAAYTLGPAEADSAYVVAVRRSPPRRTRAAVVPWCSRGRTAWKVDMGASLNRLSAWTSKG